MKFKIHIDGSERQVEAGPDGRTVVDGESFQAKVSKPSDDRRLVQVGDKTYEIRIVDNCVDTGGVVLEVAGERVPMTVTEVVKTAPGAVAATSAAAVAPVPATAGGAIADAPATTEAAAGVTGLPEEVKDGIWAPVPGKIVDVFVKAGDVVDEGTAVLVLEAMKMENELHAPHKGTVAAVLVKKGDQADKGQLLVAFA